ncbi:6283_t:CDS:2, partial [Racocetra fulgida]
MSLINLQNFALNILKETKHNIVQNIIITELPPYLIFPTQLSEDSYTYLYKEIVKAE